MRYRLIHLAEYAILRIVISPAQALPYRLALLWGWWHAAIAFFIFRYRVAETVQRIESVFGDRYTHREARRIAWQSWRNMAFNAVELMRLRPNRMNARIPVVEMAAIEQLARDVKASGRGAIFACPHMGNWELAGLLISRLGLPFMAVAAKLKNPLVNGYLQRLRTTGGIDLIERGSREVRHILPRLQAGGVLAVLPDARSQRPGISVSFLGSVANVYPGMAALARKTGVPIYLGLMRRTSWTRHHLTLLGCFEPDPHVPRAADVQRMTQSVFDRIDEAIRETPGQWFWFNRRWVLDPL